MKKKPLNKSEDKCFEALYDTYENEYIMTFKNIADETKLSPIQVKRAVRSLVRMGLVKIDTAFNEDTGLIMGKGFILTYEAWRDKYNAEQHP